MATVSLIDIHAHLDMLDEGPAATIARAKAQGVDKIITIGTEPADHDFVLRTAKEFYPDVYCTLGVHPHHGAVFDSSVEASMRPHLRDREVVAVGEIGLDYYYEGAAAHVQKEAFARQLALAEEFNLPVEIHTRDAEADTIEILQEYRGRVRGLIHCFTGTWWLAERCLDLGYNISFSGVVTFKNAEDLRATCKKVPLNRMHVETDAPFLTPVPLRGKKNTPAYVVHTAQFVADLHGIDLAVLAAQTNENTRQLFPKII